MHYVAIHLSWYFKSLQKYRPSFCSILIQIWKFHPWMKNIGITYLSEMWYILFLKKNMLLVSVKLQILHTNKLPRPEKNTSKSIFCLWPATLWKLNFKFAYIYQIFAKYCQIHNHLKPDFRTSHSTRPKKCHIFPAAYLNCNWFWCKSPL